jgi:hypothetical protein
MAARPEVLVVPDFANLAEVAALQAAFRAGAGATLASPDAAIARRISGRTEVACRNLARFCEPAVAEHLTRVRLRAVDAMTDFLRDKACWPDFTLLTEMHAGDSLPLHADAERSAPDGWEPNHTSWRIQVGLVYLNTCGTDYRGGLLRLPGLDQTFRPAQGMLISFPAGRRYVHEVTEVEAGRRLSLSIWLTRDPARAERWRTRPTRRPALQRVTEPAPGQDNSRGPGRLRPAVLEELTQAALQRRASWSAGRLLAVQSADGYFQYRSHPLEDRQQPGPGNLVRQAGCAFALTRLADRTEDPGTRRRLASAAGSTLDALLGRATGNGQAWHIRDLPKPGKPDHGKLGTLALTLAAMQSPSLAGRHENHRERLLNAILACQRPDGSFRCRTDSTSAADDGKSQDYYPGEALLALATEARAGSAEAEKAMSAALPWYRAWFRTRPATAFIPWQLSAWALHADWASGLNRPVTPGARECSAFIFEMADWLRQIQLTRPQAPHPELAGGFASPGRLPTCSSASYTEAMIRAFGAAEQSGNPKRAKRYRETSLLGLEFVRRLQITPETASPFGDPSRTVGATTASLFDLTMRCDYDQHTLTAFLAALETKNMLNR